MKTVKKEEAITLIALVVTIVIMLILAGIGFMALGGENGLLSKTFLAKSKTNYSFAREKLELAKVTATDLDGKINKEKLIEEINKVGEVTDTNWPMSVIIDGYIFNVSEDGNIEYDDQNAVYQIEYELNGGTNNSENPDQYQKTVYLKEPTKEGYSFDGWYLDDKFETERVLRIDKNQGDIKIYAKWNEEIDSSYFTWSTSSDSATIKGFSNLGTQKYNAGEITKLIIPKKYKDLDVKEIAYGAFSGKDLITELVIPEQVSKINSAAFSKCVGITKITIPISLCTAYEYSYSTGNPVQPFDGCTSIVEVNFTKGNGSGYNYRDGDHSYYCTPWYYSRNNNIKVRIAEDIIRIGNNMFCNCNGMTQINLPSTISSIGANAFANCTGLNIDIKIPKNIQRIEKSAFNNCTNILGNINDLSKLEYIGEGAFYNCKNITGILKFPNTQNEIYTNTFRACENISEIIIGENVTKIDNGAFYGCSGIKKITVPVSLCTAYEYSYSTGTPIQPFDGCTSIEEVNFTKGSGEGYNYRNGDHSYYCTPWYYSRNNKLKVVLEDGISKIGSSMFNGCVGLEKIKIPDSVTIIGEYAFNNCTNLKDGINIPTNVTSIGNYAFNNCSELLCDLTELNNLTYIGIGAFNNCQKITGRIKFPEQQNSIYSNTFSMCQGISEVIIGNNVTSIANGAFYKCTGMRKLTIPISLCPVYEYSFSTGTPIQQFDGCNGIEEVHFTKGSGNGYNYRSGDHSYYCTPWYFSKEKLKSVIIDSDILSIGSYTFYNLGNVQFQYKGTQEQWNNVTIKEKNDSLSNSQVKFDE